MAKVMFASGSRSWANNLNDLRERWNIRREEPVNFVVPVDLFKLDVANLSRDELIAFHEELLKLLNKGKRELQKAQSQSRSEGIYLSSGEYSDLVYVVKSIGTHIEVTKNALSKISQQKKQRVVQHFIDVCREKLSKEQWSEFMDEANRRIRSTE